MHRSRWSRRRGAIKPRPVEMPAPRQTAPWRNVTAKPDRHLRSVVSLFMVPHPSQIWRDKLKPKPRKRLKTWGASQGMSRNAQPKKWAAMVLGDKAFFRREQWSKGEVKG